MMNFFFRKKTKKLNEKFNKWWDSKTHIDLIGNNYTFFVVLAIIGIIGFSYVIFSHKSSEKHTLIDRFTNDVMPTDEVKQEEQGDTLLRLN